MRKRDISDSESEDSSDDSDDSSSKEDAETANHGHQQGVSEYEKQRLSRIAENKARLEALGLLKMASSVKGFAQKVKSKKGKEKKVEDDEDYRPDEGEARSGSSSEDDENDDDFVTGKASASQKRKVKNKGLKQKAKVSRQKHCSNSDYMDDDDEALKQAIALSLQDSSDCSINHLVHTNQAERNGNIPNQEDKGKRKNKKSFTSRLQMTEDEVILHFFQFDEAGKGTLTLRDLQKVAVAHDFTWTDKELVNMIRYFDSDGDGKLSLEDFRKIVVRCHMIQESENS